MNNSFSFSRSRFYFLTITETDFFGDNLRKPFTQSVWLILCVSMICISVAFKFTSLSDRSANISSILTTFGVFCQQGILKRFLDLSNS